MTKKSKSRDVPLAEITLRRYEKPGNLEKRELVRRVCLSVGLLQPGDSRDVIVDIFRVLLDSNKVLTSEKIIAATISARENAKVPILGITQPNVQRQLKRLKDMFLIEKIPGGYRMAEHGNVRKVFEDRIENFYLKQIVDRVGEYFEALQHDSEVSKEKKKKEKRNYQRSYNQRDYVKVKIKKYYKKNKAKILAHYKTYLQRPEIMEKKKKYMGKYTQRPEVKARKKANYKIHQQKKSKEKQIIVTKKSDRRQDKKMPELNIPLYLKGEELKEGITAIVIDGGRIRKAGETGFKDDVLEIEIELSNKEMRTWSLNKTSYINLADIYGKNSDSWIGKKVRFEISSQKVGKEMKQVIYGYADLETEKDIAKAKEESEPKPETVKDQATA